MASSGYYQRPIKCRILSGTVRFVERSDVWIIPSHLKKILGKGTQDNEIKTRLLSTDTFKKIPLKLLVPSLNLTNGVKEGKHHMN